MVVFDDMTGELQVLSSVSGVADASYLAKQGDRLLAIRESGDNSALATIGINGDGFTKPVLIPYSGVDPCHISLSPVSNEIVVANYSSGDVVIFKNADDFQSGKGMVIPFKGCGPDLRRQKSSHAHCAVFSHDGKRIYVCDLGADRIHVLHKTGDGFRHEYSVETPAGYGPRMIVLNSKGTRGYVICELSGKVLVLDLTADRTEIMQEMLADRWESRGAGDIRLSPDGKFLYASVRLAHDGIAIYSVDQVTGLLTDVGYCPTGVHPRNFQITPDGSFILVACRDTNEIEVYRRNAETGQLTHVPGKQKITKIVCIAAENT